MWRRIQVEGVEWEVRVVTEPAGGDAGDREILEFRPVSGAAQPRRVAVERDSLDGLDETALERLHRSARPIGGDHYGRPGKSMDDAHH